MHYQRLPEPCVPGKAGIPACCTHKYHRSSHITRSPRGSTAPGKASPQKLFTHPVSATGLPWGKADFQTFGAIYSFGAQRTQKTLPELSGLGARIHFSSFVCSFLNKYSILKGFIGSSSSGGHGESSQTHVRVSPSPSKPLWQLWVTGL